MIRLDASEIEDALGLKGVVEGASGISTDTRSMAPGDLFVAIKGDSYDGHAFVPAAVAAGASGVVVEAGTALAGGEEWVRSIGRDRVYRVPSSVRALGNLARAVRRKSKAKVVGVTGSVGKTSTKDLMCAMAASVSRCVATNENENNEIGVPLTLLRLEKLTDVAIVEMGMRGEGEIAELARIAEPDVGLITTIAPVHLELLGDLEAVSRAKSELLYGVKEEGWGVIPRGVESLERQGERAGCRVLQFAVSDEDADVQVSLAKRGEGSVLRISWPGGGTEVEAPFTARHRLENVAAAAAGLYAAGLPMEGCIQGIGAVQFSSLRGDEVQAGGITILNDTYNASPVSVKAALDVLAEKARAAGSRPLAVLGDMLELGDDAPYYHREIGAYAGRVGVRTLWATGDYARATVEGYERYLEALPETGGPAGERRAETSANGFRGGVLGELVDTEGPVAADEVARLLQPGDVLLVKGSRGLRLERMVEAIAERLDADPRDAEG